MSMRYGVDWGNPGKLVIFTDGKGSKPVRVEWAGNFEAWIHTLKAGDIVLVESPFEPYHHKTRNNIIDYCEQNGITLLTINPRETSNERINQGIVAIKSDEDPQDIIDAKIIFNFLRQGTKHFPAAKKVEERPMTWKDEVNMDRRNGWVGSMKLYQQLPAEVPAEYLDALANGAKKYADGFVLPVIRAAVYVKSIGGDRTQFERELGCYGGGFPSYLRATFYRRVRTLDQRILKVRSFKKAGIKIVVDHPEVHKENMKKLRKASRWIFSTVKV